MKREENEREKYNRVFEIRKRIKKMKKMENI